MWTVKTHALLETSKRERTSSDMILPLRKEMSGTTSLSRAEARPKKTSRDGSLSWESRGAEIRSDERDEERRVSGLRRAEPKRAVASAGPKNRGVWGHACLERGENPSLNDVWETRRLFKWKLTRAPPQAATSPKREFVRRSERAGSASVRARRGPARARDSRDPGSVVRRPFGGRDPSCAMLWFYKDKDGVRQGPFYPGQMRQWWVSGFFPVTQLVGASHRTGVRFSRHSSAHLTPKRTHTTPQVQGRCPARVRGGLPNLPAKRAAHVQKKAFWGFSRVFCAEI